MKPAGLTISCGDGAVVRATLVTAVSIICRRRFDEKGFAGDRFKTLLGMIAKPDAEGNETPLDLRMFSRFVENAQRKVEGSNYDRRKSVVEYDEVLRKQREIIYQQRSDILFLDDMEPTVLKMIDAVIERNVDRYVSSSGKKSTLDLKNFMTNVAWRFFNHVEWTESEFENKSVPEIKEMLINKLRANLEEKKSSFPEEVYREFLKVIMLRVVDRYWMDHIDQMSELRQSIGLKSYAQINPLREYRKSVLKCLKPWQKYRRRSRNIREPSSNP